MSERTEIKASQTNRQPVDLSHPAFRFHHSEGSVVPESMDEFLKFVGDLDPAVDREKFTDFLTDLFASTQEHWRPGKCMNAFDVAISAREILPKYYPDGLVIVMLHGEHVWNLLWINSTHTAIDPAGVFDKQLGSVVPYFGKPTEPVLQGQLLEDAKKVYTESLPLSDLQEAHMRTLAESEGVSKG